MNTISINQAKNNLQEVVQRVLDDVTPTIMTTESGESVVILTLDEYNAWQKAAPKKSIAEEQAGYTVERKPNKADRMTRVELIQSQIKALPYSEFARLRKWFIEKDWSEWDKQIETDAAAGKLDFLVEESRATQPRVIGLHEGAVWMSENFDEPLPDDFWLGAS